MGVAHGVGSPEDFDAVETCQVLFEDRWDRENAFTRSPELPEQLGILELADNVGSDIHAVQPLVDRATDCGIRRLKQQRCGV